MNTDFPENLFKPDQSKLATYSYRLGYGRKILSNKSILFCGICKDVERVIELNIHRLIRIGSNAKNFHIFIYENNSKDNTPSILKSIKSNHITIVSENTNQPDPRGGLENGQDPWHYNRCKIISECRNKYLEYAKSNQDKYDYICVVDLDLLGGWSNEGFLHAAYTLENVKQLACVSAYGILSEPSNNLALEKVPVSRYLMYDSFAYRPIYMERGIHITRLPIFNKLSFRRGEDPVFVRSNFGGMAIYKTANIVNKKYYSKQWEPGFVDPDHVNIHSDIIKDGFKIMIDPSMICSHSKHKYCEDI